MEILNRSVVVAGLVVIAGCSPQEGADNLGDGTDMSAFDANEMSADIIDATCSEPAWTPGACAAGTTTQLLPAGSSHVSLPEVIEYADNPPASGDHRGEWAKWGEYEYLPPQRWLHNLEHGGAAFLYHPCAPQEIVDALRETARSQPEDPAGEFRWVMTPYPGLPTAVAVVTWTWKYEAECVDATEIGRFLDDHYRQAPEDVASDGRYDDMWIGD